MTPDDLVEKVARAMAEEKLWPGVWERMPDAERETFRPLAFVAIKAIRPVALEEAAKVVAAMPRTYDKVKEGEDVLGMKATWTFTLNNGPPECAAAIRALKEDKA